MLERVLFKFFFSRCSALRAVLLPGCNPSLALCCERCWLASVAQHPVPIQVVGCCPSPALCSTRPRSLDHACWGTWFARPCVPSTSPVGKAGRPMVPLDAAAALRVAVGDGAFCTRIAVPAGRRGTSAARNFRTPSVFKNLSLPPS